MNGHSHILLHPQFPGPDPDQETGQSALMKPSFMLLRTGLRVRVERMGRYYTTHLLYRATNSGLIDPKTLSPGLCDTPRSHVYIGSNSVNPEDSASCPHEGFDPDRVEDRHSRHAYSVPETSNSALPIRNRAS